MTELELWSDTFRNAGLPELARAAAGAGFAAVTVTPALFVRSGGDAAHLRARVEDVGMRVTFVDGLCSALPGTPPARSSSGNFNDPQEATLDDCIHSGAGPRAVRPRARPQVCPARARFLLPRSSPASSPRTPDLPVGAEVLSDEVDALGLAEGTETIARLLRSLVDSSTSRPLGTSAGGE